MNANKEIFPDKNLHVDTIIEKDGLKFIEVRNAPFEVYGLYDYKNQSEYKRLPDDIGLNVNEGCGSTHIENLCRGVRENHLDVGFAYDGGTKVREVRTGKKEDSREYNRYVSASNALHMIIQFFNERTGEEE